MAEVKKCAGENCGRSFQLNEFEAARRPNHPVGVASCPHCGTEMKGDPDKVYIAHALFRDED